MKKIIPTIGMALLGLSAVASSSFAWFSMNKTVTATGMSVKARAEGGIEIARKADSSPTFGPSTTSSANLTALLPTSTTDTSAWYHAEGKSSSDGAANDGYTTLSITNTNPSSSGVGHGDVGNNCYYLYDTYTVRSDANSGQYSNLWVSAVDVAEETAQDLSSALRVLIKSGDKVVIAAPVSGATLSYKVNGSSTSTTAVDYSTNPTEKADNNVIVAGPASTADISVYVYFEGEDANLKTDNVKETFESLSITVKFTAASIAAKTVSE